MVIRRTRSINGLRIVTATGLVGMGALTAFTADDSQRALSPRVAPLTASFRGKVPVRPAPDGTLYAEAEEFQVLSPGWRAKDWGENLYFSSFANTFLSRKAFLGAGTQGPRTEAAVTVLVPRAGRYLALVRYEAAYRFETQFTLRIEQNDEVKLQRLYGARANDKIWAFRKGIQTELAWGWGACENMVWEGHDVFVALEPGVAALTLSADAQPEPAAPRNVDLVMLTLDHEQVAMRVERENYLPLDGMLTQAGDVHVRFGNEGKTPITIRIPPGREHSPYWVHLRSWKPRDVSLDAGAQSDWIEVGGLLDTLNDGQWFLTAAADPRDADVRFKTEFAVDDASGLREPIATFDCDQPTLRLTYDANLRYTRRIRSYESVLDDVLGHLESTPVSGRPPRRMIVYGYTFDPIDGLDDFNRQIERLVTSIGLARIDRLTHPHLEVPSGYVRPNLGKLDEWLEKWREEGVAEQIRTVNFGDEISLSRPSGDDHPGFREWARAQGLTLESLGAKVWEDVVYQPAADRADVQPAAYYYSRRYVQDYGIARLKDLTDRVKALCPHADSGANFSPHHGGAGQAYTGSAHKWITLFRKGGLTMPWSEDYIWQLPVGSPQINFLLVDLFRAGVRYRPGAQIQMYVMPHWPGNRPDHWRRLWYGNLGSGMQIANLFEFRPVQASYTENYVNHLPMYAEVRRAIYETAGFEDIVLEGRVRWGNAGLWYSDTGDVWDAHRPPFGANKRLLYVAIRHQQLALDVVDEEDALRGTLDGYKVLYLCDSHVSDVASQAIADWVAAGGRLLATAGAGLFNQFNAPNTTLRTLYGMTPGELDAPEDSQVRYAKQDLPFARVLDRVTWPGIEDSLPASPVIGARASFDPVGDNVEVLGVYADKTPAVIRRRVGAGQAIYAGFPVGLSYFQPAIPRRPTDRSITKEGMTHFIPTNFDPGADFLVGLPGQGVARAVTSSESRVQASLIDSPRGVAIPLVNWADGPQTNLVVSVKSTDAQGRRATLAGGGAVLRLPDDPTQPGRTRFRVNLDVADALLLRPKESKP